MALDASTFETISPCRRFITFTIPNPISSDSSSPLLRVAVLDSPIQQQQEQVAAMFVPQGRESDWIFSTQSGQLQLLFTSPTSISRFILIGPNHFNFKFNDHHHHHDDDDDDFSLQRRVYRRPSKNCSLQQQQQFEVWSKPLLLALSPRHLFRNGIPHIPILSYQDNLVSSLVIHQCVGSRVGQLLVEDVEIEIEIEMAEGVEIESEGGEEVRTREFRRRMRFKRMPNFIQTEIPIVPERDPGSNGARIGGVVGFVPDIRVLVHPYLPPMVASLSLISEYLDGRIRNGFRPRALCLGVGGGALITFLTTQLGFDVVGVDSDREVLRVAKRYFGLEEGDCTRVVVGDAIKYLKNLACHGRLPNMNSFVDCELNGSLDGDVVNHKFDVVMVDLDSSDIRSGMSSPPLEFVRKNVLLDAKLALSETGILAINVIPPTKSFYENLVNHFLQVFQELYKIDVGNGENFVLIAAASPQEFPVGNCGNSFLKRLKSVIPEANINSITKI
ncbi:hypothetical protein RIF29_18405 [Crotalaria pallida]|uniref:Methyltransferase-like protein 13 n=1 Tax=Crotalaria pallida TaxID=3830 RepID=A0AAN9IG63_CROPI